MPDRMLAALDTLPSRKEPLKEPVPFLMPKDGETPAAVATNADGGTAEEQPETHMVLPPEKENRKIRFQEDILVTEIENRFYLNDFPEDDDEGSYEIEIVEDDGEADFYLEIVDGEVFYVFETEDDISLESEEGDGEDGDNEMEMDDECDIMNKLNSSMFINADDMMLTPDLEESDNDKDAGPPMEISIEPDADTMLSFNQGSQFLELDNLFDSSDEEEGEKSPEQPSSEFQLEFEEPETSTNPSRTATDETLPTMEDMADNKPEQDVTPVPTDVPCAPSTAETTTKPTTVDEPNPVTEPVPEQALDESDSPSSTNRSFPVDSAMSMSQGSTPSKTKSILRSNPASPIKTPKKDRSKKKKTTKTFSKTYVRADQLDGEHRVYSWTKPDWTKERKLRQTGRADLLREGKLEAPITFFPKKPVNEGLQEEEKRMEDLVKEAMHAANKSVSIFGTRKSLKVSVNGAKLREGQDIVKPITQATVLRTPENINKVANPGVLRPTQTGEVVRQGGTLAAPVTFPKKKVDGTNPIANKNILRNKGFALPEKKQYEWSKPDWTKTAKLRHSAVGDAVKQGADLQGPITQAPHRRKSFESCSSSGSSEGAKSDEAVVAPRRGGRRNVPDRTKSMPSSNRSHDSVPSNSSIESNEAPMITLYEKEKLRKQQEQSERQKRLAQMARTWKDDN